MAEISKITLPNGNSYDFKDSTARANGKVSGVKGDSESAYRTGNVNITAANVGAVAKSGDTMTGQLKTSFKNSVAMGSYGAEATTIPNLCNELRYSSGCCGSVSLGTAYTLNNITIATGWYNFLWVPHRSGGVNGSASGDNCNYGSLFLSGMTVSGCYIIRYSSSSIAELQDLYADKYWQYNSTNDCVELVFPS